MPKFKDLTGQRFNRLVVYSSGILTQRINKLGMSFDEAIKTPSRRAV